MPSASPVASPDLSSTAKPTAAPIAIPTTKPKGEPTAAPTTVSTLDPVARPTAGPTAYPSVSPTSGSTVAHVADSTAEPAVYPSVSPNVGSAAEQASSQTADSTAGVTSRPNLVPSLDNTLVADSSTGSNIIPAAEPVNMLSRTAAPNKSVSSNKHNESNRVAANTRKYIKYRNNIYYKCGRKKVSYVKPVNRQVKYISIPDTIKYKGALYKVSLIEKKACCGLKKLCGVVIGNNVTVVGENAFSDCRKLEKIIFGIRINKLENAVFFGDSGLKTIKFKSDKITSFGRKTFRGVKRNVDILIPVAMAKKYSGMIKKAK